MHMKADFLISSLKARPRPQPICACLLANDPDLEDKFPRVHEHLTRTRVMTHALVFEWQGSDSSLKPLLLTGHQGTC